MFRLLQTELKKVFHKKGIYIIWGLMFIFCLLNNILYWTDYDEDGNYKYLEEETLTEEKSELEKEITQYDKNNQSEASMYITLKTKLDILELKQKFSYTSWQYHKINTYLYDTIYQINYYQHIEIDENKLNELTKEYENTLDKLNNNDYHYFLNLEIIKNNDNLKCLEEQYKLEKDKKTQLELKQQIEEYKLNSKILNYRLNNNIKEDKSYLNVALENYQENYKTVTYFKNLNSMSYQEKLEYQKALSEVNISKYIIENKQNINKQNNLNYQLRTIIEDYEIFIVIMIFIVCSIIICDEFKDGTIKLLLIKPFSRGKILLSKYFTAIIIVAISILGLILMQLIIGGFFFKFDSLDIPVVVYDLEKMKLIEYTVFEYMLIRIMTKIPFVLILIVISFFLGVLTNNTVITITLPLMLYMFSQTFLQLAIQYNLKFMKYLVNVNWNLQDYLFGNLPKASFMNFKSSVIILLLYFIILLILTFINFKKKNIKNI